MPEIVMKEKKAESKAMTRSFGFSISEDAYTFIQAHKKTVNFSKTMRKALDDVIAEIQKSEAEKRKH